MDITSVNKRVREYLNDLGYDFVDPGDFAFDGFNWHVSVVNDDRICGTVVVNTRGEVLKEVSYPQIGLDKPFKLG